MRTTSLQQLVSQTIAVEQTSSEGNAQPVELDIQALECQAPDSANGPSQPGAGGIVASVWKTTVKMVIHQANDRVTTRMAKLDTAAAVNVLSKSVADDLGVTLEPYHGPDITPLGDQKLKPLGQVTLRWHVMQKGTRTYTTEFVVLDTDKFDALLCEETIGEIGFYKVDKDVWSFWRA